MTRWTPDPTFYASPRDAAGAPAEKLAYVAAFDRQATRPDAIAVVDTDPDSDRLRPGGRLDRHAAHRRRAAPLRLERVQQRALPDRAAPARGAALPDRPGLRSSRMYVIDTKDDPRSRGSSRRSPPRSWPRRPATPGRTPSTAGRTASTSRRWAAATATARAASRCSTTPRSRYAGRGRTTAGPQYLAYDFWWHLTRDVLVSCEWGTPSMIEDGLVPELLLGRKYGHRLHFWDLAKRNHVRRSTWATSTR